MTPLRIFLVMVEPPLPFGNPTARWFYVLLKGLVQRGHRVSAFATCSRPEQVDEARTLFPTPDYDLRPYPHPTRTGFRSKLESLHRPHSYMFAPDLKKDLARGLQEGFDVLHLEGLWSGWLGLHQSNRALINVHNLLSIDVRPAPARTPAERLRRLATRTAERRILRSYPLVSTLTERLSDEIRQIAPDSTVVTNPLPLDFTHYPWEPHSDDRSQPVVTLIGSFRWQPTYSAAHRLLTRLWPAIRQRVPEARLQIVGRDARAMLREFMDEPNVTIHEDVPEIRPYFAAADALLYAPAPATGMKVKVLEAFALGLPVVTTPDGVEGIAALDGAHAGIATEDGDLVERTVALLRDPELRAQRRLAARRLVESTCDPRAALDRLTDIYGMVGQRAAP